MDNVWCIVSSYAFYSNLQGTKNKVENHNAHTAFWIKTNRSSYLSPLIIWCSMRFFYALDTSLNSSLVAYAPSALYCLLLCCLLSKSILIKKCYSKIHGIDKENWVSNIFSACNRLKKFARNNKKPYYELNASNSTPWWSHVPTLSINLYVLQLIEMFSKITLVTIFIPIITNVKIKLLLTFSEWYKNLIKREVKEIYDLNIECTNFVHKTNSQTWLNN